MVRRLDDPFSVAPFTGHSRAIGRVMEQVRHLASTHAAVLIEGEVGTGKGLAAQAIHLSGPRRSRPFVRLDCGAMGEALIERELFGFEPGESSVDGAARTGRLDLADGGTLFLDEIHALAPGAQVRMLRVLQDHAFERVDGRETLKVDVRLIAASRDLAAQVREERFREDLFQRLGVVRIVLPPLRERREDIPLLVDRILADSSRARSRGVKGVTRGVLDRLMEHPWPGNVRELREAIEAMVTVARRGRALELADLGQSLEVPGSDAGRLEISVGTTVEDAERQLIAATLAHTRGDKPRAAALLGIGLRTLYRKIKAYGVR